MFEHKTISRNLPPPTVRAGIHERRLLSGHYRSPDQVRVQLNPQRLVLWRGHLRHVHPGAKICPETVCGLHFEDNMEVSLTYMLPNESRGLKRKFQIYDGGDLFIEYENLDSSGVLRVLRIMDDAGETVSRHEH